MGILTPPELLHRIDGGELNPFGGRGKEHFPFCPLPSAFCLEGRSPLKPIQTNLPELLWQILEGNNPSTSNNLKNQDITKNIPLVYQEVIDFLIQRPTPEDITNFKVSNQAQNRLEILLAKNREKTLTSEETAELDIYENLEHLMMLLKIRASDYTYNDKV